MTTQVHLTSTCQLPRPGEVQPPPAVQALLELELALGPEQGLGAGGKRLLQVVSAVPPALCHHPELLPLKHAVRLAMD